MLSTADSMTALQLPRIRDLVLIAGLFLTALAGCENAGLIDSNDADKPADAKSNRRPMPAFAEIDRKQSETDEGERPARNSPKPTPNSNAAASANRAGEPSTDKSSKRETPEQIIERFHAAGNRVKNADDLTRLVNDLGDRLDLVTKLDLSTLTLPGQTLLHIKKLTKLEELDLSRIDWPVTSWTGLAAAAPNLKSLNVSGCRLSDGDLSGFRVFRGLTSLDLTANQDISDRGFEHLVDLRDLEVLKVTGITGLTGQGFAEVRRRGGFSRLREVEAAATQFGLVGFTGVKNLESLERLDASNARVNDGSLGGLVGTPNLRILILADNIGITDAGLKEVRSLKHLERLDLRRCQFVGDAGLAHVKGLSDLRQLRVEGTKVSSALIARLTAQRRDLEVTDGRSGE